MLNNEEGKIGWILLWALGIPLPILVMLYLLILNIDKEKLESAPGFEESDNWPDFSDTLWGESIYKYYDFTPPWKYDHDPGNTSIKPE